MPPDDAGWPHVLDPRGFAAPAWEARKRAAFAAADVALAASGTVSLELAAAGTPMVIAYDASPLTAWMVQAAGADRHRDAGQPRDRHPRGARVPVRALHRRGDRAGGRGAASPTPRPRRRSAPSATEAMALLGRGGEPPGLRAARSVLGALERIRR